MSEAWAVSTRRVDDMMAQLKFGAGWRGTTRCPGAPADRSSLRHAIPTTLPDPLACALVVVLPIRTVTGAISVKSISRLRSLQKCAVVPESTTHRLELGTLDVSAALLGVVDDGVNVPRKAITSSEVTMSAAGD